MSVSQPETRYARSGEVSVAYQVTGAGSVDFVYAPGVSQHVELNCRTRLSLDSRVDSVRWGG
jgi:hypothetical protein